VLDGDVETYGQIISHARAAGMPLDKPSFTVDELFPRKKWRGLSLSSTILDDPYTGVSGVEELGTGMYRVSTRMASPGRIRDIRLSFQLMESFEEMRRIFLPLLDRFYAGEDYRVRPVKISDSGRIRNELQTWCSEALEHFGEDGIRLRLNEVDDSLLSPDKKKLVDEVLRWYKQKHPIWFHWLEIA
jgi:hypothetical protein